MYKNSLVAAIQVGRNFLKEDDNVVRLPFGSEYLIYLHNMDTSRRALVNITIDGSSVTDNGLILDAGKITTLERAIGGNLSQGKRFKFIERTSDIESYRGVKPDDGIIKIEFRFEVSVPPSFLKPSSEYQQYSRTSLGTGTEKSINCLTEGLYSSAIAPTTVNQVGITGKGNDSYQSFVYGSIGVLENTPSYIVFQLLGELPVGAESARVTKPVAEKFTKICSMCGRKYSTNERFCSHDGNSLEFRSDYYVSA